MSQFAVNRAEKKAASRRPQRGAAPGRLSRYLLAALLFLLAAGGTIAAVIYFSRDPDALPSQTDPPPLSKAKAPGSAPEGMVWIPGGWFWMGSDYDAFRDARPAHLVYLVGFWMDQMEVTNAQFENFVEAAKYVTVAERKPDAKDFPGVPADKLVAGSIVFKPPKEEAVDLNQPLSWWDYVPGACWRNPEGPGSSLKGRENHPVVHVCHDDAVAYCKWAGKRLPTEAEWEFAARGGLDRKPFVWGDEPKPGGKWMTNIWQGKFPVQNSAEDGFRGTAPVGSFPANGYGLHDMAGNVWEWCADWYRPDYYKDSPRRDPRGPKDSHDPNEPGVPKRVQRGGSLLCSDQYCVRYMNGGRGKGAVDSGLSHLGFRCVQSPK